MRYKHPTLLFSHNCRNHIASKLFLIRHKSVKSSEKQPTGQPSTSISYEYPLSHSQKTYDKAIQLYLTFDRMLYAFEANQFYENTLVKSSDEVLFLQRLNFYYSNIPLLALEDIQEYFNIEPLTIFNDAWNIHLARIINSECQEIKYHSEQHYIHVLIETHNKVMTDFSKRYTNADDGDNSDQYHIWTFTKMRAAVQLAPMTKVLKILNFNCVFKRYLIALRSFSYENRVFTTLRFIKQNYHFEVTNRTIFHNFVRGLEKLKMCYPLTKEYYISHHRKRRLYNLIVFVQIYDVLHLNGYPIHTSGALEDVNQTHMLYVYHGIISEKYFARFFGENHKFDDFIHSGSIDKIFIQSEITVHRDRLYLPLTKTDPNNQMEVQEADIDRTVKIDAHRFKTTYNPPFCHTQQEYCILEEQYTESLINIVNDISRFANIFQYDLKVYLYRNDRYDLGLFFNKYTLLYKEFTKDPNINVPLATVNFIHEEIPLDLWSSWHKTLLFEIDLMLVPFYEVHIINHIFDVLPVASPKVKIDLRHFKAGLACYANFYSLCQPQNIDLKAFFVTSKELCPIFNRCLNALDQHEKAKLRQPQKQHSPFKTFIKLRRKRIRATLRLSYPYSVHNFSLENYFRRFLKNVRHILDGNSLFQIAWGFIKEQIPQDFWDSITKDKQLYKEMSDIHIINNLKKITLSSLKSHQRHESIFKSTLWSYHEMFTHELQPNEWRPKDNHYHDDEWGPKDNRYHDNDLHLIKFSTYQNRLHQRNLKEIKQHFFTNFLAFVESEQKNIDITVKPNTGRIISTNKTAFNTIKRRGIYLFPNASHTCSLVAPSPKNIHYIEHVTYKICNENDERVKFQNGRLVSYKITVNEMHKHLLGSSVDTTDKVLDMSGY